MSIANAGSKKALFDVNIHSGWTKSSVKYIGKVKSVFQETDSSEVRHMRVQAGQVFFLLLTIILIGSGCSSTGLDENSVSPDITQETAHSSGSGHMLWSIWNLAFDPATGEISMLPSRDLLAHFDVTDFVTPPACNDCVKPYVNSYNPGTHILDVDVALRNPGAIPGRDVRGILYTNEAGHELLNPDGWTPLYDIPGGGTLNPFKAFAKSEPSRVFASGAEHSENYLIRIPTPPKWNAITFAVDASWPGNCKEPYSIDNFHQEKLFNTDYENAEITVDVADWQDDVTKVTLVATQINGESFSQFAPVSGSTWHLFIKNTENAPPGDYQVRVIASSPNPANVAMYQYFTLNVDEWGVPADPVDLTPPWLNFSPQNMAIYENFAYVAAGINGLHVFDISDPSNPAWLSSAPSTFTAIGVDTNGSYTFVAAGYPGVDIYDTTNPLSPIKIATIDTGGVAYDLKIQGGYAYVANNTEGLVIIDIDPVESASVIKTVTCSGSNAKDVAVDGDYAYLIEPEALSIININPPESAFVVKSVATLGGTAEGVEAGGGYAYIADYPNFVDIVDVDPPETASQVLSVPADSVSDMLLDGNYLYAVGGYNFAVLDVTNPPSAFVYT